MVRKLSIQDATRALPDLLTDFADEQDIFIVDDSGDPVAVVLSPDAYLAFRRERAWALVRQVQDRNADKDPDTVLREVTETVDEVRQERYDRAHGAVAGGS